MAAGVGEVIVDFGTGTDMVSVSVARTSVTAATHVEAYVFPLSTGAGLTDHNVDEHLVDPPKVFAHSVVATTGFTITAVSPDRGRSAAIGTDYLKGKYTIRWVATE